jgi:hypothetical protein
MRGIGAASVLILGLALAACATPYQSAGSGIAAGGYEDQQLEGEIWRVTFGGNGFTTRETAQTYWLYHCAEVAIEHGFDGFEILSNVQLSERANRPIRLAASTPIFIPTYHSNSNMPLLVGDIHLLKKPFDAAPPKIYDAAELKKTLEVYVAGDKCWRWNVCHHVHSYLQRTPDDSAKSATTR